MPESRASSLIGGCHQKPTAIRKPAREPDPSPFLAGDRSFHAIGDAHFDQRLICAADFTAAGGRDDHFAIRRPGMKPEPLGQGARGELVFSTAIGVCDHQITLICAEGETMKYDSGVIGGKARYVVNIYQQTSR